MKKYVKPELFYERFELTEHIAACDYDHKGTQTDPAICTYTGDTNSDYPGAVIFIESNIACDYKFQEYCYYTGTNGMNTFNS